MRCAIASFDSKNGVLVSQHLVLDTEPVLIEGGGNINLNDETFSMRVQGHPKHFQPFRLRVPIGVRGKLDNPQITINPVPALTQGGIGVALGAITPSPPSWPLSIRAWPRTPIAPACWRRRATRARR